MVSLRKLFLIPAALVLVASVAPAASLITCVATLPSSVVRSEGRTEKLNTLTLACTPTVGATAAVNFQIAVTSPTAMFTSPATGTSAPTIKVAAVAMPATTTVSVSPAAIIFSGVTLPTAGGAAYNVTIDNIYVDASQLPLFSSPSITVSAVSSNAALSDSNLFAVPTLSNTFTILNVATIGKSLTVYDSLNVGGVQKPTSLAACATESIDVTLPGSGTNGHVIDNVTFAPLSVNSFVMGSRLEATFTNLPSGVQLYVPLIVTGTGGTVASLVSGFNPTTLAGGFVASAAAGSSDKIALVAASGVIVYEITVPGSDLISFDVTAVANGPILAAMPVSLSAGYAPIGGTLIPRFVGGTAISSNFLTVAPCSSSLFFPYVVAGGGYDTGIAISSSGVLGDASKAASGQCVVSFMGKGAPMTTKTLDVTVGQTNAFDIVGSMPTANFYGYAVAKCNFLNASGYAYVANSTGGTASYLPLMP